VAGVDGELRGVWNFNILFDTAVDLHTEASVAFLTDAGVDFPRHAVEGIDLAVFGMRLASSPLVGSHASTPWWVTFAGSYDLGYLLKILTDSPLPADVGDFDATLAAFCPSRYELRDQFPRGSLESLVKQRGIQRSGVAHTAGSDALATLELFQLVVTPEERAAETATVSVMSAFDFSNSCRSSPLGASHAEALALQSYLSRFGGTDPVTHCCSAQPSPDITSQTMTQFLYPDL